MHFHNNKLNNYVHYFPDVFNLVNICPLAVIERIVVGFQWKMVFGKELIGFEFDGN